MSIDKNFKVKNGLDVAGNATVTGTLSVQGVQSTQGLTRFLVADTDGTFYYQNGGTQGAQGIQGIQGVQGTQGRQGVQGVQGTQGTQGEQGIQGVQGTQGIQGTGFTFRGPYDNGAQYYVNHVVTYNGSSWICIQTIDGVAPAENTWWTILAAQGVQGIQGIQGAQGIQGITGIQGLTGIQGAQGLQGIQGFKGTEISISETAPAYPEVNDLWWNSVGGMLMIYYNDGDSSQWVSATAGIVGAQGSQGVQGIQGVRGIQGSQGIQGIQGLQGTQGITGTTGSWTLTPGSNTVSFTVSQGYTYTMWVNGNIPNGICVWNATVTVTNSNVPVIGQQFAWYYTGGNMLVLTSIPAQIIGTAGTINTSAPSVGTTTNVFTFGITNNSGSSQVVNWGYATIY